MYIQVTVTNIPQMVVVPHERVQRGGGVRARAGAQRRAVPQQHAARAGARLLRTPRPAQLHADNGYYGTCLNSILIHY